METTHAPIIEIYISAFSRHFTILLCTYICRYNITPFSVALGRSLLLPKLYSLSAFKWHKSNIKNLLMKSSEIVLIFLPAFYLIIWLMKSLKNFEKISFLKIWQTIFFWGAKIYFGKFLLKRSIFRSGKIWFSQIMPLIVIIST